MVRKTILAILVVVAIAAAFYLGYWFNKQEPEKTLNKEEETASQPAPAKTFQGPTSSPSGIKGPSGPPPGQ